MTSRTVKAGRAAGCGQHHARLKPIYLGDDLLSRQPICEAVRAADGHFLFVCKPSSHQTIEEYLTGIELPTLTHKVKRGRFDYRYRWLSDVPLRGDADALIVNWLMIEIVNAAGEVTYRNSFVTDLDVGHDTVVELAACGRARWKIENESFNVLKNNGYNLEHNFGHGKVNLSAVFVSLTFRRVRLPEPSGFRFPYRLRFRRRSVAQGDEEDGDPVLRKPAIHHHLPDLPHRPSGNA